MLSFGDVLRCFSHHQASVNGEVIGIYVSAGGLKCSVVIADRLVCIANVSGLGFDGDVFLAVEFSTEKQRKEKQPRKFRSIALAVSSLPLQPYDAIYSL